MKRRASRLESLVSNAKDNPAVSVTLAGLLAYVVVRFTLGLFYGRRGLDPQDVGLGYAQALEASAGLLGAAVVLVALMLLGFRVILDEPTRTRGMLLRIAFVTSAVLGLVILPLFGWLAASSVKGGYGGGLPGFGIRAYRVDVTWTGSDVPSAFARLSQHCRMYLGDAQGVSVLYDATSHAVVRVPDGDVLIVTDAKEPACPTPR